MRIGERLLEASELLKALDNKENHFEFNAISAVVVNAFKNGNKVLICGNGGSACDAMHFAEELTGKFHKTRPALPCLAITDPGHITCVSNDWSYRSVFSRYIEAHGKRGDILIVLSTSGNSENLLQAIAQAKAIGMTQIALLGRGGGHLKGQAGLEIIVPSHKSERIQEVHMLLLHSLVESVERSMFPENYKEEK